MLLGDSRRIQQPARSKTVIMTSLHLADGSWPARIFQIVFVEARRSTCRIAKSFYGGGAAGYTDYPNEDDTLGVKGKYALIEQADIGPRVRRP